MNKSVGSIVLALSLIFLSAGLKALEKKQPYFTDLKPQVLESEVVKPYNQRFLSCEQINGPTIYACQAYGVAGMRLCYIEQDSRYLVVENEFVSHLGFYSGNDCMERFRLQSFLCKHGYESSDFSVMKCIQRTMR